MVYYTTMVVYSREDGFDTLVLLSIVASVLTARATDRLAQGGHEALKPGHGRLVQHLLTQERSIRDLAHLLGVTHQAASKTVGELATAGYVDVATGGDARMRIISLSQRGQEAVRASRAARAEIERKLHARFGPRWDVLRTLLEDLLEEFGVAEQVVERTIRLHE